MAALPVLLFLSSTSPDGGKKGVIESGLDKMSYSVSGGTLKEAGEPRQERWMGKLNTTQSFSYTIYPGAHVGVSAANAGPSIEEGGNYSFRATIAFHDEQGNLIGGEEETVRTRNEPISISKIMPYNAVDAYITVYFSREFNNITANFIWRVPVDKYKVDEETVRNNEEIEKKCANRKDSKIRFNDFYGQVDYRCEFEDDDAYEYAEFDTIIYEDTRIRTHEDSGAILGLEDMSTYVIKPESILIIHTEDVHTSKLEHVKGAIIGNIKKMSEGKSIDIEMTQCCCGINGTIFYLEETGLESTVWLFAGKVTVTNKKTGNEVVLEPGQKAYSRGNGTRVYPFKIEEMAPKFGIAICDIENHYSNDPGVEFEAPEIEQDSPRTTITTSATTPRIEKEIIPDGVYAIRYAATSKFVMSIPSGSASESAPVRLLSWQGYDFQKWKVTNTGNGRIVIRSMADNNYVLVPESLSDRGKLLVCRYNGDESQQWLPESLGGGKYAIMPVKNTGFAADLYNGWAAENGLLQISATNKEKTQQWLFEKK